MGGKQKTWHWNSELPSKLYPRYSENVLYSFWICCPLSDILHLRSNTRSTGGVTHSLIASPYFLSLSPTRDHAVLPDNQKAGRRGVILVCCLPPSTFRHHSHPKESLPNLASLYCHERGLGCTHSCASPRKKFEGSVTSKDLKCLESTVHVVRGNE